VANEVWFLIVLFAAGQSFCMAIGRLLVLDTGGSRRFLLPGLLLALSFLLLHLGLVASGYITRVVHFYRTSFPFLFAIGPLFFLFLEETFHGRPASLKRTLFHLIPVFLVLILLIPFYTEEAEVKLRLYRELVFEQKIHPADLLLAVGMISIWIYLLGSLYRFGRFWNWENIRREKTLRLALLVLVMGMLSASFSAWTFIVRDIDGVRLGGLLLSLIVFILFFAGYRFPEFFQEYSFILEKNRYQKPLLEDVDTGGKLELLTSLLDEKRLYQKDNLSLAELASHLELTSHQTSQLINEGLEKNFTSLINEKRIEEACRLISADPLRTVLSVAFQVGFNSKSVFNAAFLRFKGESPSVYRKRLNS